MRVRLTLQISIMQINLIKPPHFVITVQTMERAIGIAAINTTIVRVRDEIEQRGGSFKVTQEVHFVIEDYRM